jgi:hypothetical protein
MKSTILAALLAAAALPVAAQTPSTPRVDQRQASQEVQKMENKAVADGKVTPKERARLERAQNKQSKKIAKKKNNLKKAVS